MKFFKIDEKECSAWCSCGEEALHYEYTDVLHMWVISHLINGCRDRSKDMQKEFDDARTND